MEIPCSEIEKLLLTESGKLPKVTVLSVLKASVRPFKDLELFHEELELIRANFLKKEKAKQKAIES